MNSVFLLKMRPWIYIIELPLMLLLVICWNMNSEVDGLLKLYPLIIALMALIIFLAVYLFRLVELSWEEIRDIGLFSRRDNAIVNKGKVLNLKLLSRGRIKITLIGNDGEYAGFDWLKPEEGEPSNIALYRGNAYGGKAAAKRILKYFGVAEDEMALVLGDEDFSAEYQYTSVSTSHPEDGLEINISINETLLNSGVPMVIAEDEDFGEEKL